MGVLVSVDRKRGHEQHLPGGPLLRISRSKKFLLLCAALDRLCT